MTTSAQPRNDDTGTTTTSDERSDLLDTLGKQRYFLRFTTRGLTDEQARQRTTVSELTLGGLVKHVTAVESQWIDFVLGIDGAMGGDPDNWPDNFVMTERDSLEEVLAVYEETARRTDEVLRELPDLNASRALPEAPWFEPGARWSARRVLLHLIAETSQHAGHADILRESIDGQKTMG